MFFNDMSVAKGIQQFQKDNEYPDISNKIELLHFQKYVDDDRKHFSDKKFFIENRQIKDMIPFKITQD